MTKEKTERFKQSASTGLLIAFLSPIAQANDYRTITYAELSETGHCDSQHKGRCYLNRAILRVFKDHRRLFICIPDVGFKLATDQEISALQTASRRHCHRAAPNTREKAAIVDLEKLGNRERLAHMSEGAILGLIEASTRGIVQKRLEATFEKTGPKSMEAEELLRLSGVKQIE